MPTPLSNRKKKAVEPIIDPEIANDSTFEVDGGMRKDAPTELPCSLVLVAIAVILAVTILAPSYNVLTKHLNYRHVAKKVKILEYQNRSLAQELKNLTSVIDEEDVQQLQAERLKSSLSVAHLRLHEEKNHLKRLIEQKEGTITKLNEKNHRSLHTVKSIEQKGKTEFPQTVVSAKTTITKLNKDISSVKKTIDILNEEMKHHKIDEKEIPLNKLKIEILQAEIFAKQMKLNEEINHNRNELDNAKEKSIKDDNYVSVFCYECAYRSLGQIEGITCGSRLRYLVKRYRKKRDDIIPDLMKQDPACKKKVQVPK